MNLNNFKDGILKKVFDDQGEAFSTLYIEYYLVGSIAMDVLYSEGKRLQDKLTMLTLQY